MNTEDQIRAAMMTALAEVQKARKADMPKPKRHPALDIPGVHIRHEIHGEPVFTGED